MTWLLLMALAPAQAGAGQAAIARGAQVFTKSCAVAYCHGPQGTAGPAPQLAGRRLDPQKVLRSTRDGVSNTSMPGFKGQLSAADLIAVVAYVINLGSAPEQAPASPSPAATLPTATSPVAKPAASSPEATRGKELFHDPGRIASCGTCHRLDGWGTAVGPDLVAAAPAEIAAFRGVPAKKLKTARPSGEEAFPALEVEKSQRQVQVYDLTVAPPVLRTFLPADVKVEDGGTWDHARFTKSYSDADLAAILAFIRALRPS